MFIISDSFCFWLVVMSKKAMIFFWKKEYIWHDATFEIQIYNCSHLMLNGLIFLLMLTTSMVRICTPVLLSCDRAWSTLWSIFRWQSCLCAKRTVYAEFLIIQESVTYTLQLGGPVENLLMRRNSMLMFEETASPWVGVVAECLCDGVLGPMVSWPVVSQEWDANQS